METRKEILERYPYFIYPAVMALREGTASPEEAVELRRIVAANVGDTTALRLMLGLDPEEFAEFYPDLLHPSLSTADTIDSFLSRFGNPDASVPAAAAEIPHVSAADYAIGLGDSPADAPEAQAPADNTSSAIDAFLAAVPLPQSRIRNADAVPAPHEEPVSEAEARILIKNHDYQAALEIIQRLSLINPEKSVYFADQIRFLKKLILNEAPKTT